MLSVCMGMEVFEQSFERKIDSKKSTTAIKSSHPPTERIVNHSKSKLNHGILVTLRS